MTFLVIICIIAYFSYREYGKWQRSGYKYFIFIGHNKEDYKNSYLGIKLRYPVRYELLVGRKEDV